jgi:hypothetical protein
MCPPDHGTISVPSQVAKLVALRVVNPILAGVAEIV